MGKLNNFKYESPRFLGSGGFFCGGFCLMQVYTRETMSWGSSSNCR